MKQQIASIFLLTSALSLNSLHATDISSIQQENLSNIFQALKNNDQNYIATHMQYPIIRKNPLSPISNKKEFLKHYDELIDNKCVNTMGSLKDVTLDQTYLWLFNNSFNFGEDGNEIMNIFCTTKKGEIAYRKSIDAEKKKLHKSIKNYDYPILTLKSKKFKIRIDMTNKEKGIYRYVSWSSKKDMSDKPDLVLTNLKADGTTYWVTDGTRHYTNYTFKNNGYSYTVWDRKQGEQYMLEVTNKKDKIILEQILVDIKL